MDDARVVHPGVEYSMRTEGGWVQAAADFSSAGDERLVSGIYRSGPFE